MDEFISVLNRYPNGTEVIVEWENHLKVKAELDTIYETDNGLELEEEGYEEYFACALKILSIEENLSNKVIREGELLELSKLNKPSNIYLVNGELIWKSNESC
ncbi:hypothetical protein [Heyndrickxia coagulans]|uniref:hypothetical protein n=1 Tax=Heyndrickxia coagulans TaxID=1398 RepID=UPI0004795107|nr:hypothetical protein [Heyndrickxia coagulans]